ncbi:intracellular hyaluronan-binding protein 4.S-like isoform X2 [Dendrobates tinctorius]|uniref:intracellular hyaluronan-binding protein 4.S-like isoform X2 n=1 Tax=Dendrobates tinctorius TaxID=92724 RepID=UPI003CCA1138
MKPEESPVSSTMQDAFGCVVENRFFHLLDDESDPLDFLHRTSSELGRKKKKEEAAAKKAGKQKSNRKESQKDRKAIAANTEVPGRTWNLLEDTTAAAPNQTPKQSVQKVIRYESSSAEVSEDEIWERRTTSREFRSNFLDHCMEYSVDNFKFEKEKQVRNWVASHRGIRGGGRGFPRYTENENQRGKREFDRHSGSDRAIRAEDKRGGGGPHNWGSFQDTFSDVEPVPVEATETEPVDATCDVIEEEREFRGANENYEEYVREMSLDEWKSILDQSRPKAELNLRKPESNVPAKAIVIHKSKFKNNSKEDEDDNHYNFRKSINDITSQLEINFGSLSRPARGGRGRGRGRFRREDALPYEVSNVPELDLNPDDPDAFPALI